MYERPSADLSTEFMVECGEKNAWTEATFEKMYTMREDYKTFRKNLKFSDLTEKTLTEFVVYLRDVKKLRTPRKSKGDREEYDEDDLIGLKNSTIKKKLGYMRWFLNWAVRKRYASEKEIGTVQPKFKVVEKPVIFLTKDELLKLYKYEIPANGTKVKLHTYDGEEYEKEVHDASALAKTRDLFCFCAFTSLRYSDMASLKRGDIHEDYIDITTQKTHDHLPINLNAFAREILDKYKDCKFPGGLSLPVICNQRMNDYIKDLCELCEFNDPISRVCYRAGQREEETRPKYELIGTHAGRRTFICFALSSGIPPQVVMKWTGHSDYKAMKPYIDIAERTKADAMKVIEDAWSK